MTLDCTYSGPFLDYMQHRKQLRRSVLSNVNIFQYNWHHCDDWTDYGAQHDQDSEDFNLISGIPMSVAPITWSFNALTVRQNNNVFQHDTWFVFVRKLTMSPGTVIVE